MSRLRGVMLPAACLLLTLVALTEGLAVMSVDLGGEFMKIAIVKPGVPMEIVLNKDSARKTRTVVAFRDGERQYANMATTTSVRFPKKGFQYMTHLLGKHFEDPQVAAFQERFPYYTLLRDEKRGTVLLQSDEGEVYSPEELLAMVLEHARDNAEAFAEQPIRDAVITVPAYFNQAERRAVLAAARMVDLNVLQLMSDNAAVALNYGVFRRKNFNSTTQYYVFYDMGASSTTATVVGYQVVKMKEGTRVETNPQLTIKGVGFDRSLGGLEMTMRLRNHLAKAFNEQKKTPNDVFKSDRSMAKLLKEADRVKQILSANADHYAQVEGLLDDKDFKLKVTREELEAMCADLFDRVVQPLDEALKSSEVTLDEVTEVILFGGGTRMPKVQELLMKRLNKQELGKSINTDEAAALGAVYQAAFMGQGFKVKRFAVREGNIYPIVVEFDRQKSSEDTEKAPRRISRQLFGRMNPFPQKKVMTFNKHFKDFSFAVAYGELDFMHADEQRIFANRTIANISLSGVEEAAAKVGEGAESKGVKAHFRLDESGLLTLDKVESVFERQRAASDDSETAWSKLGKTIGGLFGGGDKEGEKKEGAAGEKEEDKEPGETQSSSDSNTTPPPQQAEEAEEKDKQAEEKRGKDKKGKDSKKKPKEAEGEEESAKPKQEEEEKEKEKKGKGKTKEKKEKKDKKGKESKKEETADKKTDKDATNETKEEGGKPSKEVVKELVAASSVVMDLPDLAPDTLKDSRKRLSDLRAKDEAKAALEKSKNDLEAFIFNSQTQLEEDEYQKCSTEKEREELSTLLAGASDWLYDQPEDTTTEAFKSKLKELKTAMAGLTQRVKELQERPKALEALRSMLNHSRHFLTSLKNLTASGDKDKEEQIFTQVEVETLEKLINETEDWRKTSMAEQKKLALHEMPTLLTENIALKIRLLEREINYLLTKAKNYRPKAKPKAKEGKNATKTNQTESGNQTDASDDAAADEKGSNDAAADEKGSDDGTEKTTSDDQEPTIETPTNQEEKPGTGDDADAGESESATETVETDPSEEQGEVVDDDEKHTEL